MIDQAIRTLRTLLTGEDYFTRTTIESAVDEVLEMRRFSTVERDVLLREALAHYTLHMDDFRILEGKERREPWLLSKKSSIQWNFWNRYKQYLEDEKNFAPEVLNGIDRLTDRILDNLFDPTRESIQLAKKGLVVGQVQSGKTSNYTGLICKAADSGFRLIIVMAGIHDNLRSQTQLRLDEGFLGFDTQHLRALDRNKAKIGVGNIRADVIAHSLTSSEQKGDFSKSVANSLGINFRTNEPIMVVVKKNSSILKRLYDWLSSNAESSPNGKKIRTKSLLLIDDEADNASINTNGKEIDPTKINGHIRSILGLFDKSAYIGYTATPFANIFISVQQGDDLFPRDFIINLPSPDNYIGPALVFGLKPQDEDALDTDVLPIAHCIRDHNNFIPDRHKLDDVKPNEVPESLRLAIRCFILVCAIRRLRGQTEAHNSMLVHVSRFISWQGHVKEKVEAIFMDYRSKIQIEWAETVEEFRRTFEEDNDEYLSFVTTSQRILNTPTLRDIDTRIVVHDWESVRRELNEAIQRIEVREINGSSGDALNYFENQKKGLSVIAIGGDKLSRGLTLEGLSVSYYLRATRMYDTLMQMGRWFGYRSGYVDLCRLFTSRELNEWFAHIAYASEELRSEFNYMADTRSTPEQYALRVRTHPGQLQISAANKTRHAVEVNISWAGKTVESYLLSKKKEVIQSNLDTLADLIEKMGGIQEPEPYKPDSFLWRGVAAEHIQTFLNRFVIPDSLLTSRPDFLEKYIADQVRIGEMGTWNVALMSKSGTDTRFDILKEGKFISVGQFIRKEDGDRSDEMEYAVKKSRLISKTDEFMDTTSEIMTKIKRRTQEVWEQKENKTPDERPPGEPNPVIYRNEIRSKDTPLLILYLIDPVESTRDSNFPLPIGTPPLAAFAIAFPGTGNHRPTRYAIHEEFLPTYLPTDLPDDDDDN